MNPNRYLGCLALCILLGVSIVAGAGVLIDPYGLFEVISISRFNSEKTERLGGGGRFTKSIELHRKEFDTLILGSSRTLQGIHPAAAALEGETAYNASVQGTDMHELHEIGRYALQQRPLKRLIVGIDFHMFLTPQTVHGDFASSAFAGDPLPLVYLRRMLSLRSMIDAGKTVGKNVRGWRSPYLADGSADWARVLGRPNHWRWFEQRLARSSKGFLGHRYSPEAVARYRDLVIEARRLGIDVRMFISPTHALHLEKLSELGVFPLFEQWKRDVTNAIAVANRQAAPGNAAQLWDFSGYNAVTTEPLPGPGDSTAMQWYWEASHYKRAAGDMILARMLRRDQSMALPNPRDFGVRLSADNIERHLTLIRSAQRQYRVSQSVNASLTAGRQKSAPSPN